MHVGQVIIQARRVFGVVVKDVLVAADYGGFLGVVLCFKEKNGKMEVEVVLVRCLGSRNNYVGSLVLSYHGQRTHIKECTYIKLQKQMHIHSLTGDIRLVIHTESLLLSHSVIKVVISPLLFALKKRSFRLRMATLSCIRCSLCSLNNTCGSTDSFVW